MAPSVVSDLREVPGQGIEGRWQGRRVRLGRADWVGAVAGGETATWLASDGCRPVAFRFADGLRPGAVDLIVGLRDRGLPVTLLSGDAEAPVSALAGDLGIADWRAGVLPQDKAAAVRALEETGAHVLMIGDGLNDTAALAGAHASISPASALDAARVASDVVLLGKSLDPIADALSTSRVAIKRIRQNFSIATWYNIIAVPLAVAGLCSPLIAALAMSTSSITVSLNALRLK